ncbi:PAS domain S-box-containing protein [Lutibacter sp. Hel_I_33_5]|uniref:GAF domain-containing sensor histidine kinase n=1 Tax=Lutibacter sp. Hel_I_33_5 TaxID=1566289 RepID=UPI00119F49BC|nr:ATP-binding protein [Lutibacter sp. Hel_I_33_5]TVZ56427.1 PAS domain S-box-containing protein [Lutibacter sp. Hel_I_33_5]
MKNSKIEILERALERQIKARKQAEKILEEKSLELYNTSEKLKVANTKLESLLDEKTSQLKGIFENINDAYIVVDIEGNVLKMNENAEELLGYTLNNNHLNINSLVYKEDYTYAINSFKQLLITGNFTNYNARILTKENQIKWVNINASVVYDNQKNAIAVQGIIRDVTHQREKRIILDMINNTVKSILGKENIYEIAWEISSSIANYLGTNDCVIYLVDHSTNTLEQIAAFDNKLNPKKEIANKIILPIGKGIVGSVAKSGNPEIINDTSIDNRYVLDDENRLSEITVPIISEGNVIGIIDAEHKNKNHFTPEHLITIQNIANLVALQLKSAINLRERKKAETQNKELLLTLEKNNEELQEYAHIVTHDLKSPLRSLYALTSWLKTDNIDSYNQTSLQYFNDIELTLEKMESLISDVLSYSSLEANQQIKDPVALDVLIKDIIQLLYVPENITIKTTKKLPILYGDKTLYQRLFQNLIENAIKFNDKPQGTIEIDVKEHKSFYKFSVKDNGIGIEKKHFTKIFKIFQSLKKAKDSTGIGLSVVKKIVDIYKGEIWVESQVNKGTTFYFTIKK